MKIATTILTNTAQARDALQTLEEIGRSRDPRLRLELGRVLLRRWLQVFELKWTPVSRPLFRKNKLSPGLVSWLSREVHCMRRLVIQRLMKALVVVKMEVVGQSLA